MHISLDSALGRQRRLNSVGESVFQIAPDAAAGYSLRSLTGGDPSVVRVRRESDNGERDFNASGVSSGELVNWVNQQITPPLDLRELTATGRDGPIIEAAAAYSLRNLSDSYTGSVVDVRRSSDGNTAPFTAAEVTDGTLVAWVGAGNNGTVSKWYDQSTTSGVPNANHAVQTDAASQPKIVDGGTLVTQGGLAAINFDSSSKHFDMASIGFGNTWSMFGVINATGLNSKILSQSSSSGGAPRIDLEQGSPDKVEIVSNSFADADKMNLAGNINTRALTSLIDSANSFTVFTNGLPSSENPKTINGSFTFSVIGSQATQVHQELILYNSDQTDNRTALEANIGEVYSIAGIPAYDNTVNGFIETWYDQSGNGNNATQLTAGSQPKIVSAGSLVTGGLDFDGVDDTLDLSGTGLDIFKNVGYGQVFSVATSNETGLSTARIFDDSTTATRFLLGESNATAGSFRVGGRRVNGDAFDSTTASTPHGSTENLVTGFANWSDAEAYIYQNGANVGTDLSFQTAGNTQSTASGATSIGKGAFDGKIREVIVYNTDQTANRVGIETNINNQYDIY